MHDEEESPSSKYDVHNDTVIPEILLNVIMICFVKELHRLRLLISDVTPISNLPPPSIETICSVIN